MSAAGNNTGAYPVLDAVTQNAAGANGNGASMAVGGMAGVMVQIVGGFVLTINFEITLDGANWIAVQAYPMNGASGGVTTTGTPNIYWVSLAGADQFRTRISGFTSGSVTCTCKAVAESNTGVANSVSQIAGPWTMNLTQVGGTNVLTGGVLGSLGVGGLVAQGVTQTANPLNLGATFTQAASLPAVATGQAVGLQADPAGNLKMGILPLGAPISAGANVAAAANNQTLAAAAGKTTYLSGFVVSGLGATGASGINITTTGLATNLNFVLPIPAGVTVGVTPLEVTFTPPLPSSAVNTAIVLNVPSFGAGNTTASATMWGFQL